MTEAEWLACGNPIPMLEFLRGKRLGCGDRKRRLFSCACCRRIWRLLPAEETRNAVETAERYADGAVTDEELCKADGFPARGREQLSRLDWVAVWAAHGAATRAAHAVQAASYAVQAVVLSAGSDECAGVAERSAQAALLRDLMANPFRPFSLKPSWLRWNEACLGKLAQSIYEERAFDRLPVLADALEEAGCSDADVLAHCRQPGAHVRGCWVVDLLLGKS
jgi:hypothetical protein